MIFTAELTDRSKDGHYFLEGVQCENGMHREHAWVNGTRSSLGALPIPAKLRIDAQYRRYRPGPDGWTLCRIRSVEIVPEGAP